jgi:hypothetical protein
MLTDPHKTWFREQQELTNRFWQCVLTQLEHPKAIEYATSVIMGSPPTNAVYPDDNPPRYIMDSLVIRTFVTYSRYLNTPEHFYKEDWLKRINEAGLEMTKILKNRFPLWHVKGAAPLYDFPYILP